ncbi:retrovirus-related Pol polyprotein from transposon 297 [Trichonephila clavipes]|uniref:Retrovirus-related Pol polyprotein from transposon 297 n=1 Tax=Trichonephila clavipes TaxID=2585209 RepID=A0A8X6SPE6_TRICX|nr:retrovirus-related Pol polyprotein from transposon 297 [Trichonephila clavipes]
MSVGYLMLVNQRNWRNSEVVHRPNNGRKDYRGNYPNNRQGNQWFESRNRFQNDDRRFNDRGYQFRNRGQNDYFSRGDQRNRGSSENFSRGSRKQMGRLNVLKTKLLRKHCGTRKRRSHLYRKRHNKSIFFYKQVKKSSTRVITAQGAKCRNIGVVELNIRIRDFEKPWLFHVLADLEYPCILGIYFIGGSKIILDFDRKSLAIPDSQINKVVKTVELEKVEIDLSKTKLEEQKRELQDLFNSFQGLFSDKPGLTHVLYHEIDTGDNPPVVSRPYKYDRFKQEILDYHADKMLKEGIIIPIQSPHASPVVLCRKNNGLPPDNPEAYRFAVDYRKLNAITKYLRFPLPLIDDLIMNIPHAGIMSALDLRSGYFQMAVNPSDIVKTAFVTKNGTYAFRRMSFGLSGAAPNSQKAIDIILKPVIGKSGRAGHTDYEIVNSGKTVYLFPKKNGKVLESRSGTNLSPKERDVSVVESDNNRSKATQSNGSGNSRPRVALSEVLDNNWPRTTQLETEGNISLAKERNNMVEKKAAGKNQVKEKIPSLIVVGRSSHQEKATWKPQAQ